MKKGMNTERVLALAAYLRQPGLKKCSGYMENTTTGAACVLGHAARFAMANGCRVMAVPGEAVVGYYRDRVLATAFDGEYYLLPSSVREWYGFGDCAMTVWWKVEMVPLETLNDDIGLPLTDIAEILEQAVSDEFLDKVEERQS